VCGFGVIVLASLCVALLCDVCLRLHPVLFPAGEPVLPSLCVKYIRIYLPDQPFPRGGCSQIDIQGEQLTWQVLVQASEHARRQLDVLSEARYFDSLTQRADVYVLTYNSQSRAFGVTTFNVEQSNVGFFHIDVTVSAVNTAWPATTRVHSLIFPLATSWSRPLQSLQPWLLHRWTSLLQA
jgi:hypothetical protein